MLVVAGSRVCYRTVGQGVFHCERCGGDRPYRQRAGRRWAHVLGIPVLALGATGEHLRCEVCRTCYRVDLLAVPTAEQMQVALLAATRASVLALLRAGCAASRTARSRAVEAIRDAGAAEFDEAGLATALADPGAGIGLRPAMEALTIQLEGYAREWFLANVVHVGLADGHLGGAERAVAEAIARHLGMSDVQGRAVIAVAEEAAQAG